MISDSHGDGLTDIPCVSPPNGTTPQPDHHALNGRSYMLDDMAKNAQLYQVLHREECPGAKAQPFHCLQAEPPVTWPAGWRQITLIRI